MASPVKRQITALSRDLRSSARLTLGTFAVLWVVELVDFLIFRGALDGLGVQPRTTAGLLGIFAMPLLHGGFVHLLSNTVVGAPLAFLTMSRKRADFFVVAATSTVTAGLGAWLFGASGSVHVGASGVVFGLLGFLLTRGIFERRVLPILLSLAVAVGFGGMLAGVLPGTLGISWQAHLFGLLGGVLTARALGEGLRGKKKT